MLAQVAACQSRTSQAITATDKTPEATATFGATPLIEDVLDATLEPTDVGEITPETPVTTERPASGCNLSTVVLRNNTAMPIPDAVDSTQPGVISSTIHVENAGNYLWQVTVTTNITHTYNGDLDILLISPAGTIVTLSTNNGGSLYDVFAGSTWSDKDGEINSLC